MGSVPFCLDEVRGEWGGGCVVGCRRDVYILEKVRVALYDVDWGCFFSSVSRLILFFCGTMKRLCLARTVC